MKRILLFAAIIGLFTAAAVSAADKVNPEALIEAAKNNIEKATANSANIKSAVDDLQLANIYLKKAEDTYAKSREWLGLMSFGDKKIEAERDIAHYTQMVDQALVLSKSHVAKAKADEEAEMLDKQAVVAKNRIKIIEGCRSDLGKLKGDSAKFESTAKELAAIKAEKAALVEQVEKLKGENTKLGEQLAKLNAEIKTLSAQLDDAKKAALKPATAGPAAK